MSKQDLYDKLVAVVVGENLEDVIPSLIAVLAGCGKQLEMTKKDFMDEATSSLSEIYDLLEEE